MQQLWENYDYSSASENCLSSVEESEGWSFNPIPFVNGVKNLIVPL